MCNSTVQLCPPWCLVQQLWLSNQGFSLSKVTCIVQRSILAADAALAMASPQSWRAEQGSLHKCKPEFGIPSVISP